MLEQPLFHDLSCPLGQNTTFSLGGARSVHSVQGGSDTVLEVRSTGPEMSVHFEIVEITRGIRAGCTIWTLWAWSLAKLGIFTASTTVTICTTVTLRRKQGVKIDILHKDLIF